MSRMATGKGIMGGRVMGGDRRRYNIRNSSFIDLAIPCHTRPHVFTRVSTCSYRDFIGELRTTNATMEFVSIFHYAS